MVFTASVKSHEFAVLGGKLKLLAVIEVPTMVDTILKHIGRAPHLPPRAKTRRLDLFEEIEAAWASAGSFTGPSQRLS